MRKKQCKQMKTRIFEHVAPARYGKVSLNDAYRLFSHLGSRAEIEKCLDELVKNGVAEKVKVAQGKSYVFEEIALEFGRRWAEELTNSRERHKELENEVSVLQGELEAIERMRGIWLDGWEHVLRNSVVSSSVSNYISSVVFGQYVEKVLSKIKTRNGQLLIVRKRIKKIQSRLGASYNSQSSV